MIFKQTINIIQVQKDDLASDVWIVGVNSAINKIDNSISQLQDIYNQIENQINQLNNN